MQRKAQIKRKSKETDIAVKLNIDGSGKAKIDTGIGILDQVQGQHLGIELDRLANFLRRQALFFHLLYDR